MSYNQEGGIGFDDVKSIITGIKEKRWWVFFTGFCSLILLLMIIVTFCVTCVILAKINKKEGFDALGPRREYSRYPAGVLPGTSIVGEVPAKVNTGDFEVDNPNYIRRSKLWEPTDENILNEQVWQGRQF